MTKLDILCDNLKVNIEAKRHHQSGLWDVRILHAWIQQPLLTSAGFKSIEEALLDLETKCDKLENQRVFIERKNKERDEKISRSEKEDRKHGWNGAFSW